MKDMDIDFMQSSRPRLVTEVLQCCTKSGTKKPDSPKPEPGFFEDLTISKRIEALLIIVTCGGVKPLTVQFHCARETCEELIEIELTQDEITALQPPADNTSTFCIPVKGKDYFFRKPTGSDQTGWLNRSFADEQSAVASMIDTLWVSAGGEAGNNPDRAPVLDSEGLEAVDEGMKAIDPLVHFKLTVNCPACNRESTRTLDLEDLFLRKLHKTQQELVKVIHCLASFYHWSEGQILAVSPRRRQNYLALIYGEDKNVKH